MPTVLQYRGACLESEHPASAVAVRGGRVVWQAGDDRDTTYRSSSKPFQLACSLEALGDPAVTAEEMAVGAASHSAEPAHLALVSAVLARFGAPAEGLRCGAHPPGHAPSAEAIVRAGGRFTDLHNNCSGKHAFMLAAALHNGWEADYRPFEHPLQQRIVGRLAQWMEHAPAHAVDGCGVPTFIQPLSAVARSWEVLARAMRSVERGSADDAWTARLGRIGSAMAAHPELTSGTGRLDLDVVRAAREPMAVKVGAGGLFCIALPGRETSVVVKVHSGAMEALPALVAWALAEAAPGAWREPDGWELRRVRNVAGRDVGGWQVAD
jgi:L-asparaginase II